MGARMPASSSRERESLDQMVVSVSVEAGDTIPHGIARRQYDDRNLDQRT
jgi:hypothetical protein